MVVLLPVLLPLAVAVIVVVQLSRFSAASASSRSSLSRLRPPSEPPRGFTAAWYLFTAIMYILALTKGLVSLVSLFS